MPSMPDVMDRIVAELVGALVARGRPEVYRHHALVGTAAWDECCGQLTAAPERIFRYTVFPEEETGASACDVAELAVNVVVRLVRCVATATDAGEPPPQEEVESTNREVMVDASIILNALVDPDWCEWWERAGISQTFVGELGGCVEVETRFVLGLGVHTWSV